MSPLSQIVDAVLLKVLRPFYFKSLAPAILGVVYLGIVRDHLFHNDLHDYVSKADLHYPSEGYQCNATELRFRTYDGHCNNLEMTGMGMKNHNFGRSALNASEVTPGPPWPPGPGLWKPDPYEVAEKLLKSKTGERTTAPPGSYSLFMSSWINLQIHDWFFHDFTDDAPWTLKWGPGKKDAFQLKRTIIDEDGHAVNTETPWWDASQIYGDEKAHAESLRSVQHDTIMCEMHLDKDGNLPLGTDGLPRGGMIKNWWAGVEALHNLFVKEHNHICKMLRKAHGGFSEEELYQTAKMVVAAQMARIHTVEWTPALLSNDVLNVSMHNNWEGLSKAYVDEEMLKFKKTSFSKFVEWITAEIMKIVQQLVEGTKGVGYKTDLAGTPYSLSEDFVSSYRMHPLLPDDYFIAGDEVKAGDMVNKHARTVIKRYGMSKIIDAFGHQLPTVLQMHNYPNFLTKVEIPGEDGPRNMAAVDILRDRERGLPRYNQARRQYGLEPARTFEDITDHPLARAWAAELKEVYADVEDVDFLVGTLAESPRPKGYLISNTAFYVFIMNASRRLLCDRFYQESFNAKSYTQEGIDHIQSTTFKGLLLRHYPELEASIGNPLGNNAFYAWTGTPLYGPADNTDEAPPGDCKAPIPDEL